VRSVLRSVTWGQYEWQLEVFVHDWIGDVIARTRQPYEARELNCLQAIFAGKPPKGACLDVGAHVGNHAVAFSRMGFSELVCIEMMPATCRLLRRNLERAAACPWQVIEAAAGSGQDCGIAKAEGDTGSTKLVPGAGIVTQRIDDLDLPYVAFAKIDVERHEREVLAGAAKMLRWDRPLLMVEIMDEDYPGTVAALRHHHYHPTRRLGRWAGGGNYLCERS
jgi:FkbM family methyltransferase